MAPPDGSSDPKYKYDSISADVENVEPEESPAPPKEKATYDLSFAFQLMSGTVWASFSLWGVWISIYYAKAALFDYEKFNIVFHDLYTPEFPAASFAICFHLVGAAYMALAGAFQLVKYIRKVYPVYHRWVGRLYILASMIASIGGLFFILTKGDEGGRPADYAFATYGVIFLCSGGFTYYHAKQRDFVRHKLWAWRLYALSLASWMYRFDYYWWMVLFGVGENSWLHQENYLGLADMWINWAFYLPNLIVVEIVFRWGENATLPSAWARVLDVCYYVVFGMTVIYTIHAFLQLWLPSALGYYESGWIM